MADDLSRGFMQEFRALKDRVRRIEAATPLYSASVTEGRLRFIGGLLRVDSGGRVEIVGTLQIDGTTEVTGTFNVTGPWELSGNGDITGTVDITGPVTISGTVNITGNTTIEGDLAVEGPWELNGDGDITGDVSVTGDVEVESGGRVLIHGGGGDVILDSSFSAPRIRLGSAQIDGGSDSLTLTAGTNTVYIADHTIRIASMATISGVEPNVYADTFGKLYRVV